MSKAHLSQQAAGRMQAHVKYLLEVIVNASINFFAVHQCVVFCTRAVKISVRQVDKPQNKKCTKITSKYFPEVVV